MGLPITVICLSLLALLGVTTGQPGCRQTCPLNYDPVCGSDGRTYNNECALKKKAECGNQRITIAHPGTCRSSGGFGTSGFSQDYGSSISNSRPDPTEEPTTLSGIYTPANNGNAAFEALIALPPGSTHASYGPYQEFLQIVTQSLQADIISAKLDPLTVVGLGFDVGNIEVYIEPGTFNGLSSVVMIGGLVENQHHIVQGVTVSGHLGELMGYGDGLAWQNSTRYAFEVNSTTDSIKVGMNVKLDKGPCTLTVEIVNIDIGEIKFDVRGVSPIIDEIKDSVINKFGSHLENFLNSQSYALKILSNIALSSIPKSDTLKNKLDCARHKSM